MNGVICFDQNCSCRVDWIKHASCTENGNCMSCNYENSMLQNYDELWF